MEKLVFRKSLWKQDMLRIRESEKSLEKFTWPDEIDNMEVQHIGFLGGKLVGRIGKCIVVPEWCEVVEEVEQQ